jgi:hypothetical protein
MRVMLLLNNNLNFLLIKKNGYKYIFIYNKKTGIYLKYKFSCHAGIFYSKNLRSISVGINYFSFESRFAVCSLLHKQIKSVDFYFLKKIVFFGKGFKIKKVRGGVLNLFFNRSHMNFVVWNNIMVKKLKKTKIVLCSSDYRHIGAASSTIIRSRCLNIFTKKGLRLSRQMIFKKVGKKTT